MRVKLVKRFTGRFDRRQKSEWHQARNLGATGSVRNDTPDFIQIEDRGSDITIFAFAGLALKYAGLPSFEFRRILRQNNLDCNLVFLRDLQQLSYHVTPSGEPGGLEFFERRINQIRQRLGSTHNVGIGVSMGGSAAFYFGTRCRLEQIIAFSPGFPHSLYCSFQSQVRAYLNIVRLLRSPRAYLEQVLVIAGTALSYRQLYKLIGSKNIWSILESYRNCKPRPRATLFFGTGCRPDFRQADLLDFPEVKRVALPTLYHNCTVFLNKRGVLGSTIASEVNSCYKDFSIGQDL